MFCRFSLQGENIAFKKKSRKENKIFPFSLQLLSAKPH